jgi:hypothetical protein
MKTIRKRMLTGTTHINKQKLQTTGLGEREEKEEETQ